MSIIFYAIVICTKSIDQDYWVINSVGLEIAELKEEDMPMV